MASLSLSLRRLPSASSPRSFCICTPRSAKKAISSSPSFKDPAAATPRKHVKKPRSAVPQTELFMGLETVPPISRRPTLINEDSARDLVRAWGIDKMHDATVLEVYPGPGGITRALLELPNVKKVIAIEEAFRYQPFLQAAKEREADLERLSIVQEDGFLWESYSNLEEQGLLKDVPVHPWDEVHPNFFLAAQLPNNQHGQQLFVQFLATTAGQMWLWRYGRFQMGFLGASAFWDKITAPPGTTLHHKLAVLMPSLGTLERQELLSGLNPADSHFHRPRGDPAAFSPIKVTPHVSTPVENYEALEYVARNMFIAKSTPWQKAVGALAAGANNLIPELVAKGMPSPETTVNQLSQEHWTLIANVYNNWPFKSEILFDEAQFSQHD
ncbi:S-adenosyl-L-methionine-dependent methyltransferase [Leucosporidium creatinivorum]|uniref:rRNA adenine N(6)-methyltransferase n=1 Tax=Leucosporidium creatinivorum TaxID=106004 RepID=A0A1Y2G395_9BASI|nr:S-adenosyl-L-methionine-dependent methyltransferase [Leucosporidium creatinivorum]